LKQEPGPFDALIHMAESHTGQLCDIYLKGEDDPLELSAIKMNYIDPNFVFIQGKHMETDADLCINLDKVSVLVFYPLPQNTTSQTDGEVRDIRSGKKIQSPPDGITP